MDVLNFLACFDGEGNEGSEGASGAPAGQSSGSSAAQSIASATQPRGDGGNSSNSGGGNRAFSQEDVNRMLAEDRRRHQERYQTLEASYQELLQNQQLSAEERDKLSKSYEDLQKQFRTKEQQLAYEKKQAEEEAQKRIDELSQKGNFWETKYRHEKLVIGLQEAAVKHDAYNPKQLITQLLPQAKLVEQLDSKGKPTGDFRPMVEMTVLSDETGQEEVLQMTPDEAISLMKQSAEHGNLFKNNVRDGIGASSGTGSMSGDGTIDHKKLTDEQWFELRKKNPGALGLRAKSDRWS